MADIGGTRRLMEVPEGIKQQVLDYVAALRENTREEAALGDFSQHTRNIAVSEAARDLRDLVVGNELIARLAVDSGALEAVVLALDERPNSEAVQLKACAALGQLLESSPASLTLAGEVGAVKVVVAALRQHPNSQSVQEVASKALGVLLGSGTWHQENQALAIQAFGVEAIVTALQHHPDSEELQRWAAIALTGLVANSWEGQHRARQVQGVEALVRTLERQLVSEAVEENAAEALSHLIVANEENQRIACEAGAVAVIVNILSQHRTNKGVQAKALAALGHLVVGNPEGQRLAGEAGACGFVLGAMKAFPKQDDVQEQACEAIGRLVRCCPDNQNCAGELGIIQAVIHVVHGRPGAPAPILGACVYALGSLVAGHAVNQSSAGSSGAMEVLAIALRRPATNGDSSVTQAAAVAIEHFATDHAENLLLARKAGVIEVLITLLRQRPGCAPLQLKAMGALRALIINNHANTKVAVAFGGVDEVISALRQSMVKREAESPSPAPRGRTVSPSRQAAAAAAMATAAAIAALGGLDSESDVPSTENQEYQELARQAGLIQAVIAKLEQPSRKSSKGAADPSGQQARLLHVVAEAVEGNYENQVLAAEAGGVEAVVATMKASMADVDVQEQGLQALLGLLWENAKGQRRGKAIDTADLLRVVEEEYPDNETIRGLTSATFEALLSGEMFSERISETDYGKRHSTYIPIADTSMRGITLDQLLRFQDFVQDSLRKHDLVENLSSSRRKSMRWEDLSMYQVRDHFVLPLTRKHECSFMEVVAGCKQPPMWMASHWWGTPFPLTVRMLQLQARSRHLHAAASVSYWFDAFANNQWRVQEFDEADVMRFPFARAMLSQSCMGTVLLCDPGVTALLRTWCVFEAHVTQQLRCGALADRCDKKRYFLDILAPVTHKEKDNSAAEKDKVTITMLQDAIGGSWNEVSDTEGVFFPLGVAHVGVGVDVRLAEASEESDHRMILNFLTQGRACKDPPPKAHPKYDELNSFVHNVFASAELYRVASERCDTCLEAAAELLQMRADVNSFVRKGQTPLFAATGAADPSAANSGKGQGENQQRDLVALLLTARADVNHASAEMKTVLDCATDLPDASRGLLIEHGAKTFADAAPDLERTANARIAQFIANGFATEQQAFIGGDAGTKLSAVAQRSLQASASILKLYHWALCRIGVQTNSGRRQANLAGERAQSVRLALESAGCTNAWQIVNGNQACLLTLTVSLAPPSAMTRLGALAPPAPAVVSITTPPRDTRLRSITPLGLSPHGARSPQASFASPHGQRTGVVRLPPVISTGDVRGLPGSRLPQVNGAALSHAGADSMLGAANSRDIRSNNVGSPLTPFGASLGMPGRGNDFAMAMPAMADGDMTAPRTTGHGDADTFLSMTGVRGQGSPLSPGGTNNGWDRSGTRATQRPSPLQGLPLVELVQRPLGPVAASPSHGSVAPRMLRAGTPQTKQVVSTRDSPLTDLDTLAGDRWFQTSITCSRSAPQLQGLPRAEPVVNDVKGLGSTTPFVGMENGSRASGSFRVGSSNGRGIGAGRPWQSDIILSPKASRQTADIENAPPNNGRPQAAVGGSRHPQQYIAATAAAESPVSAHAAMPLHLPAEDGLAPPLVPGQAAMALDGRPPTRLGRRPSASQSLSQQVFSISDFGVHAGDGMSDFSGLRLSSLPALSQQSEIGVRRHGSRVFSVTDLID